MRSLLAATCASALAFGLLTPVAGPAAAAAAQPCSAGLVALTFDDGPARRRTAKLVRILRDRRVPATFFMVGSRVRTAPRAARIVAKAGFPIGNHTWSHSELTGLSDAAVRSELRRTVRELRDNGIRPSTLMRPPYGVINARVRRVVDGLDLVPVLWNVDSRDYRGGSADVIASRILRGLRPHKSNIVLQHDGVRNSPASISAVPTVIRVARRRGYCFTTVGPKGRMRTPVPEVRATVQTGSEVGPTSARVRLTLSEPTSRRVSLVVRTASDTATAGVDFVAPFVRVYFPVGETSAVVHVPVVDDTEYEPTETFRAILESPSGVRIARSTVRGSITSDDPAPTP